MMAATENRSEFGDDLKIKDYEEMANRWRRLVVSAESGEAAAQHNGLVEHSAKLARTATFSSP